MKRYIVGFIREADAAEVQLTEIDKDGEVTGEPVTAAEWKVSGKLTADESGRVLYVEGDSKSDPKDKQE